MPPRPPVPVFEGNRITVQTVRTVQPVFSAAFIAYIEATYPDTNAEERAKKNQLCTVVPLPNHDTDWLKVTGAQMMNQVQWSKEPGRRDWIAANRLDGFSRLIQDGDQDDLPKMQILAKFKEFAAPAGAKIQQFLAELQTAA